MASCAVAESCEGRKLHRLRAERGGQPRSRAAPAAEKYTHMPRDVYRPDPVFVYCASRSPTGKDQAAGVRVCAHNRRVDIVGEDVGLGKEALRIFETGLCRQLVKVCLLVRLVGAAARERHDLKVVVANRFGCDPFERVGLGRHEQEARLRRVEPEVWVFWGEGLECIEGGLAMQSDVSAVCSREGQRPGVRTLEAAKDSPRHLRRRATLVLELVTASEMHPDRRPLSLIQQAHLKPERVSPSFDPRIELEVSRGECRVLKEALAVQVGNVFGTGLGSTRVELRKRVQLFGTEGRVSHEAVQ